MFALITVFVCVCLILCSLSAWLMYTYVHECVCVREYVFCLHNCACALPSVLSPLGLVMNDNLFAGDQCTLHIHLTPPSTSPPPHTHSPPQITNSITPIPRFLPCASLLPHSLTRSKPPHLHTMQQKNTNKIIYTL